MIVFQNDGEIDPRLAMLIGVNVKETTSPVGFFGTGLKYAIASLLRWGEAITIQSGTAQFHFVSELTNIRGRDFGVISMCSPHDRAALGFTTDLGKRWEPWMVYRELWCNAHDEPSASVYEAPAMPKPARGVTRIIVEGARMSDAHRERHNFILQDRKPLHILDGVEIYEGESDRIFYRGIAVQRLDKPGLYTYNITEYLYLTEDRTVGSWQTDPIIARGLSAIEDRKVIERTILAPSSNFESRLDYDYASSPSQEWRKSAESLSAARPLEVPPTVRSKFIEPAEVEVCPSCGRPL